MSSKYVDSTRASLLLSYLDVLQRGRSKPNTQGPGTIYESLHNIPDIDSVKRELNIELGVPVSKTTEFK